MESTYEVIEKLIELLPILIPIIIIDFGFKIYALIDILNKDRIVRWDNKIIWIIVSIIVNFGWVIYFLFGRDE